MVKKGRRTSGNVPDIASCSVKRTIGQGGGVNYFVANQMYENRNVDLASYDRAVTIANGYQFFRIKKVSLTLKPTMDTFGTSLAPGLSYPASKPNLYHMIDKSGSLNNPTLETLKQLGAKAMTFDERPVIISWRPAVLTADQTAPGVFQSAQYKISPWLSTTANPMGAWAPSVVDHLGVWFYVDQLNSNTYQYTAEIEVQFEFKKPFYKAIESKVPSIKTEVALLDDSVDGVVDVVPLPSVATT